MNEATDAELDQFYGKEKRSETYGSMIETIVSIPRVASVKTIGLPYVKTMNDGSASIKMYPLTEIIQDYGTDPKPMDAFITMFEKSTCPLVQAYRVALATQYADAWADEVDAFHDAYGG